jgi:hypothetical protein
VLKSHWRIMGWRLSGGVTSTFLFTLGMTPSVKRWSEAQIGKLYRLYSHIFRPEFMKYNSIHAADRRWISASCLVLNEFINALLCFFMCYNMSTVFAIPLLSAKPPVQTGNVSLTNFPWQVLFPRVLPCRFQSQ